jgi:hypothetical protein
MRRNLNENRRRMELDKAYLRTAGSLFALLTLAHPWQIIAQWLRPAVP